MATTTKKKPRRAKPIPRVTIVVRMTKALFADLEPLRSQGGYNTRNDGVVAAIENAVDRIVKKAVKK